jgi:hypothetical protein
MSKRFLPTLFLVTGIVAGPVLAQSLVPLDPATITNGHVYLMENVGAAVPDDSANNNNGTLVGAPTVVAGLNGQALQFNGTSDGLALPDAATINTSTHQNKTVIAVFNCSDVSKATTQVVFEEGGSTRGVNIYVQQGQAYAGAWNRGDYSPDFLGTWLSAPIGSNEWHVVVAVLRGGTAGLANDKFEMWLDGKLVAKGPGGELRSRSDDNGVGNVQQQTRIHGELVLNAGFWFGGVIDEIWILNQALPEDVLKSLGVNPGRAENPVPAVGAVDIPRDGVVSWEAGQFAQTHDVYLGTAFADVNTASRADAKGVLAGQGQAETTFDPPGSLTYGQTYYWRVDEVNKTPDNTIFKGEVWSFTVEPYGYPITPVAATASSYQAGMEPEKTIDGSGLTGDLHGTVETTMWLSAGAGPAWIQYEFDQVYRLHQLQVWNSNQMVEAFLGFGAKEVTIETSVDGTTWAPVGDVPQFNRAPGAPDYAPNTTVSLGGVEAKYVKLTINSNWGGMAPQAGLSEVRFFYIPLQARAPQPAPDATGVSVDTELNWRPGREAGSHKVYFGTDANAVVQGTAAKTVSDHSYSPGVLNLDTTYYWRVDEVNTVTYPGDVWSFTTQDSKVVDDFESYTDQAGAEVFSAWVDGFDDPAKNGAVVGLGTAVNGTFGETTIIHGDKQSMPFAYDNSTAPLSEATVTFDTPQDWTASGIKSLSLWFQGVAGNGGQLYVKINGTKIVYDGEAADLARPTWQVWNLDLSQAGKVNSVRSLTIGIEGAGAKGTLYVDDIRLYSRTPAYITPVQPAKGPVAYYRLDGDYKDASGNGRNGTAVGGPTFVAGKSGQAVSLDGAGDYITIDSWQGILGSSPFTISLWVNSTAVDDRTMVCWGGATNGTRVDFRLYQGRLRVEHGNGNLQGNTVLADGQWHHVALVVTQDATLVYPQVALYVDGLNDTQGTADPDPFGTVADVPVTLGQRRTNNDRDFQGMLDEVRIFDVALSAEEVAGLAGRTIPLHKAF